MLNCPDSRKRRGEDGREAWRPPSRNSLDQELLGLTTFIPSLTVQLSVEDLLCAGHREVQIYQI